MDTTNVEAPIVTDEGGLIVREWPAADLMVVDDFRITRLAFVDRFTDAEAVAIDLASIGATVQAASIRRYARSCSTPTGSSTAIRRCRPS